MKSTLRTRLPHRHDPTLALRSISEVIGAYTRRWPLFLTSVGLALVAAFLYIRFTPATYLIEAVLLIQDAKKAPEERLALQELQVASATKLVENEIEVLKSRQFINRCVQDLALNVQYRRPELLGSREVRGMRPVSLVLLPNQITAETQLTLRILDDQTFLLEAPHLAEKRYTFNQAYEGPWGKWKMVPTPNLAAWTGRTLLIDIAPLAATATRYQRAVTVSLINKQSPVVKLSLDDALPERGQAVLNHLVALYNEAAVQEKKRLTENTLRFLDERLRTLTAELSGFERRVSGFRSAHALTDVASQSRIYLENAQTTQQQLNDVNIQLNVVTGISQYLHARNTAPLALTTQGIDDPTLISLIEKLTSLQVQREKLLAVTPENSPVFEPLDRQLLSTRTIIRNTVSNLQAALTRTRNKLLSYQAKNDALLRNLPQQERALTDIQRQQSTKENLYLYLLQKREELSLSYASTLTDARVIDQAYPVQVKWPKKSLVLTLALLLGIVLPVAGMYAHDHAYTKIQDRKEVETVLGVPIVEELTLGNGQDLPAAGPAANYVLEEQIRCLRSHLGTMHGRTSLGRVVLLTSSVAGEGKSFLARNLAYLLAAAGRKTVLVECDMRRPSLAQAWALNSESPGLEKFLAGQVPVEQIVQPSGRHPKLDVVVCRQPVRNAAELLEQPTVEALLDYLRLVYDDVILDTPPAQLVADATVLARVTDVCLYLIRPEVTPKKSLSSLIAMQQAQVFPKLGVVLTGIPLNRRQRQQYHYYQTTQAH